MNSKITFAAVLATTLISVACNTTQKAVDSVTSSVSSGTTSVTSTVSSAATSVTSTVSSAATSAHNTVMGTPKPHWSYGGEGAPDNWGGLEESYAACKVGTQQSPIDITKGSTVKAALGPITTSYSGSTGNIINNGHTVQVNVDKGGFITTPSGTYNLLQFHFHSPSEEKFNGVNYPLVAHLVHKNAAGNLAVVAVLFKLGAENQALNEIWGSIPGKAGPAVPLKANIDVSKLAGARINSYYTFPGSLTTPPCSEAVTWYVSKNPVTISQTQLSAFRNIYNGNARPVQPLNGRRIIEVN